ERGHGDAGRGGDGERLVEDGAPAQRADHAQRDGDQDADADRRQRQLERVAEPGEDVLRDRGAVDDRAAEVALQQPGGDGRTAERASISGPDPAPPRVPSLACGGGSGWGSPGQDSCPHRSLPHGGRASGTAGASYLPSVTNTSFA